MPIQLPGTGDPTSPSVGSRMWQRQGRWNTQGGMVANEKVATPRDREAGQIELVRDAYRFIEDIQEDRRGDFDGAYGDWFDERFELLPPPSYPEGAQVFRGRSGLKRWIAVTQEIWDEWWLRAERFLVAGDQVVVLVRVIAQGHVSGVRLDRETAHIWDIADGRVTRCEVFLDRSKALRTVQAAS
jgi:ketosteroid isomerase-like protein